MSKSLEEEILDLDLMQIIQKLPGNIFFKNLEGQFLGCNENVLKLFKLDSCEDILGKRNVDIMPKDFAEKAEETDREVLETGKTISKEEQGVGHNETTAIYFSQKSPLLNKNGDVVGILGIAMDISELKAAKEQAEAANQAKTEFIETMQHDIRGPAAAVAASLKSLSEKESDPKKRKFLSLLFTLSKELLDLCNSFIDARAPNQAEIPITSTSIDINQLAKSVMDLNHSTAVQKGLALNLKIADDFPETILSDPYRLRGILNNLLGNALKFTDQGSVRLAIDLKTDPETSGSILSFQIEDTGIGIEKSKIDSIFEKFTRAVSENDEQHPGTGLGLYLVHKFVNDLKGVLHVESELGRGTRFEVQIPISD